MVAYIATHSAPLNDIITSRLQNFFFSNLLVEQVIKKIRIVPTSAVVATICRTEQAFFQTLFIFFSGFGDTKMKKENEISFKSTQSKTALYNALDVRW